MITTEPAKIPISVVTGFLGSGKTTLINQLLRDPSMANTALLINEFGAISIDTDLIQSTDDSVMELGNGCLCCSILDDLPTTLEDLAARPRPDGQPVARVLIETTGLANAGPIVATVLGDERINQNYSLDRVIGTVDGVNGESTLDRHPESVEQAAIADVLIVTKTDIQDRHPDVNPSALLARLKNLNPGAVKILAGHTAVDAAKVFSVPASHDPAFLNLDGWQEKANAPHSGHDHDHNHGFGDEAHSLSLRHDDHISSFCLVGDGPISLDVLRKFWQTVSDEAGPNLLRVKGLVNVEDRPDQPALIQGAQEVFHDIEWLETWPSDDHRTRIVFIGWDLDQDYFESAFQAAR